MNDKIKGAWTRAKVNHPRKIAYSSGAAANLGAAMLIPLDGGLTFALACVFSGAGTVIDGIENGFGKSHSGPSNIRYEGKTYLCTYRQSRAFRKLESSIQKLEGQFNVASTRSEKKRLLKKAQNQVRKQEYILEGLIEQGKPHPTDDMEFSLKRRVIRGKTPKLGDN